MFFSTDSNEAKAHAEVKEKHGASITHELLAAAAAYEAAKAYENFVNEHGGHPDHAKAKEIMAAVTAAYIDHVAERETNNFDHIDVAKAKRDAQQKAEDGLEDGKKQSWWSSILP